MSKHPLPIEPGALGERRLPPDYKCGCHECAPHGTMAIELPPDLPLREYPAPRIPDLCPDDSQDDLLLQHLIADSEREGRS